MSLGEISLGLTGERPSVRIEAVLEGNETVDYLFRQPAGRLVMIELATDHPQNFLRLLRGEQRSLLHDGSTDGNFVEAALPPDDDYRIRVYLAPPAINAPARYTLTVEHRDIAQDLDVAAISPNGREDRGETRP